MNNTTPRKQLINLTNFRATARIELVNLSDSDRAMISQNIKPKSHEFVDIPSRYKIQGISFDLYSEPPGYMLNLIYNINKWNTTLDFYFNGKNYIMLSQGNYSMFDFYLK